MLTGADGLQVLAERLEQLRERQLKFGALVMNGGALRMCGTASLLKWIHPVALADRAWFETQHGKMPSSCNTPKLRRVMAGRARHRPTTRNTSAST